MTAGSGPVGVGFIGTGMISSTYLENLTRFPDVKVVILGDLNTNVAKAQAERFGVAEWGTPDDVLSHPEVELVVNLTIPAAHAEVGQRIIAAGKHVWSEKPLALGHTSAAELLALAEAAGLRSKHIRPPGRQSGRRLAATGLPAGPGGGLPTLCRSGQRPELWGQRWA